MAHGDADRPERQRILVFAVLILGSALVGCRGCTYYTNSPCVARVGLRAADGRTDVPCEIDLVPVEHPGPLNPRPAQLGRVNEYGITAVRSFSDQHGMSLCSRVVVTCTGYQTAESAPFLFHPGLVTCPAVELGEVVLTPEATSGVR